MHEFDEYEPDQQEPDGQLLYASVGDDRLKYVVQSVDGQWQAEVYEREKGYSVFVFGPPRQLYAHSIAGTLAEAEAIALEGVHRLCR